MITVGLGLWGHFRRGTVILGPWILLTGLWNDAGSWSDAGTWVD